jgi:hypothetical protein
LHQRIAKECGRVVTKSPKHLAHVWLGRKRRRGDGALQQFISNFIAEW